MKDPLGDEFIW